jgi:hypothetical protein
MKFRIFLYLLTLALAASSTMTGYARECSNKTLKGTYANSLHGLVFIPGVSTPPTGFNPPLHRPRTDPGLTQTGITTLRRSQ